MSAHTFTPPTPADRRSPCPALNALANHNYLPHSGRDITLRQLTAALTHVYHLSLPLALLLALVAVLACGAPLRMALSLDALAAHNRIEHDASLVHADAPAPRAPAPTAPDPALLAALLRRAAPHGLTLAGLAAARAARDRALWAREGRRLGALHREIALGEAALAWLVMARGGAGAGAIPAPWAREWFGEERLPAGWVRPARSVGLLRAARVAQAVKRLVGED